MQVTFEFPDTLAINAGRGKDNQVQVVADVASIDPTWYGRIFALGLTTKVTNDSREANGAGPAVKAKIMRDVLADLAKPYQPKERAAKGTGGDPVLALARKNAKAALLERFKGLAAKLGKEAKTIAALCSASPRIAAYFKDDVWMDQKVDDWMVEQAKAGQDFMAEARATIEAAEAALATDDGLDF